MQGSATTPNTLGGSVGGTTAKDSASQMSEKAHAGLDRITQTAHSTIDRVTAAASSAAERIGDGKVAHTAQEWRNTTSEYVREHPMTAIGIAVAAGYLLSRLTSYR